MQHCVFAIMYINFLSMISFISDSVYSMQYSHCSLMLFDVYLTLTYSPLMLYIQSYSSKNADSRLAPSQWEMALQSNTISQWLDANLEHLFYYIMHRVSSAVTLGLWLHHIHSSIHHTLLSCASGLQQHGWGRSSKQTYRHFDEILITGCIGSCHFDNV